MWTKSELIPMLSKLEDRQKFLCSCFKSLPIKDMNSMVFKYLRVETSLMAFCSCLCRSVLAASSSSICSLSWSISLWELLNWIWIELLCLDSSSAVLLASSSWLVSVILIRLVAAMELSLSSMWRVSSETSVCSLAFWDWTSIKVRFCSSNCALKSDSWDSRLWLFLSAACYNMHTNK